MIYYAIFICLIALAASGAFVRVAGPGLHNPSQRLIFFVAAIGLIGIAGLRAAYIDRDYWNYELSHDCFVGGYDDCRMEPAYGLISSLANNFGFGIEGVIFIYALLSVTLYAVLIARSATPYLTLITYFVSVFFLHEMTQIRAGLAIAILLFGLDYLFLQKRAKFILCCAVAATVHISALAFLPLVVIGNLRHKPWLGVFLIAAAIASTFGNPLAPMYETLFSYLTDTSYAFYANAEKEITRVGFVRGSLIALYVICALGVKRIEPHVPKIHLYLHCMLTGICAHYVFFHLPHVPSRLWWLFGSVVIFVLPSVMFLFKTAPMRFISVLGILAFDALYLFYYVSVEELVADYRSVIF